MVDKPEADLTAGVPPEVRAEFLPPRALTTAGVFGIVVVFGTVGIASSVAELEATVTSIASGSNPGCRKSSAA